MTSVVITGANRGIGLEFARHYASDGAQVHAICRKPAEAEAEALNTIAGDICILTGDVTDMPSIKALATSFGDDGIDLLINNAGVHGRAAANIENLDFEAWRDCLDVNTIGPMRVSQAFLPHLRRGAGKKIINISSNLGGIANAAGGHYAYRSSKAALNMTTKALAEDLRADAIIVTAFHPGWVQTDMGGDNAPLSAQASVSAMCKTISELTIDQTGAFLRYDGERLPY